RERAIGEVILQVRKRKRSLEIDLVFETASADVRNIDARLDGLPSVDPRNRIMKRSVIFRLQTIGLRAAAGECVEYDDLRCRECAADWLVLFAEENSKIVDQFRAERCGLRICERILAIPKISCSLR